MRRKQVFFSFVLATISFIAARSIQEVGADHFYEIKATTFEKEDGFYNWHAPFNVLELPLGMSSLSTISVLDSVNFVAIDEQTGNVVLIEEASGKLVGQLNLASSLKCTSLAVYDSILVLKDLEENLHFLAPPYDSISEISNNYLNKELKFKSVCSHASTKRLFVLGEEVDKGDGVFSNFIYGFGLNTRKLKEKPLFEVNSDEINQFASSIYGTYNTDDLNIISENNHFSPSSLAVHPKTNEIYILSKNTKSIAVYDQFGTILNYINLNQTLANSPSDIEFNKNGDLLIVNNSLLNASIVKLSWNKIKNAPIQNALLSNLR
jgi:DNA-binding beta-propeller fold protein YncE